MPEERWRRQKAEKWRCKSWQWANNSIETGAGTLLSWLMVICSSNHS